MTRERLRPVRDRHCDRYERYSLKAGRSFQGTLYRAGESPWVWYFDADLFVWPDRRYATRQAAFRAAKRTWASRKREGRAAS